MKKIISVFAILSAILICFCACGKSEEVKLCEGKIKAIGDVTLEKLELIEAAENAFMLLSGEDKGDVKNKEDLDAARAEYDKLKDFSDRVDALSDKLDRVFSEYGISYAEIIDEYNALNEIIPEDEKEKEKYSVPSSLDEKLESFNSTAAAAEVSAVSYVKGFYDINKDKNVTVTDVGCIAQISDGTTYFLFALKYTENGEEKAVYSRARFSGTPSIESMTSYAENFYNEEPASEKTDALIKGNVVLDAEKVLSEAKA